MMTFVSNVQSQGLIILGWYLPNKKYICKKVSYRYLFNLFKMAVTKRGFLDLRFSVNNVGSTALLHPVAIQAVSVLLCMGKCFFKEACNDLLPRLERVGSLYGQKVFFHDACNHSITNVGDTGGGISYQMLKTVGDCPTSCHSHSAVAANGHHVPI